MKPTLMIIDDNEMMREFLSVYLKEKYLVQAFENPLLALKSLNINAAPDLMLLDLNMPELSGFEFLEMIKKKPSFQSIGIIILSSLDKSSERIECLSLGAQDYLVKPFHPKELSLRLEKCLASRKSPFQNIELNTIH